MKMTEINKETAGHLIEKFLSEAAFTDNEITTNRHILTKTISWDCCTNPDGIKNSIAQRLNEVPSYRSFILYKCVINSFFDFYDLNIDLSDVKFSFKYIDFDFLQNKIDLMDSLTEYPPKFKYAFCMSRLVAYLLWIGVAFKSIAEIKRKDYDVSCNILTTSNGIFDIKSPIYQDVALYIDRELKYNINNSKYIILDDGRKEYLTRFQQEHYRFEEQNRKTYNDFNPYLIRTSSNNSKSTNLDDISRCITKFIYKRDLIYKSGLFYKLRFIEQKEQKNITLATLKELCESLNYTINPSLHLLSEYHNYKESL